MPAAALRLVLAAAVLSGAAALVYEVVWLRILGLVVGHAVDALAAVLAAFMAGLAIGAALFGRLAGRLRRPLAACALLEGGIAAYAAHGRHAAAAEPGRGQRTHRGRPDRRRPLRAEHLRCGGGRACRRLLA